MMLVQSLDAYILYCKFKCYRLLVSAVPGEAVYRLAAVGFSHAGDGLWPVGVMETVGIELGFQSDAGALAVVYAALTGLV